MTRFAFRDVSLAAEMVGWIDFVFLQVHLCKPQFTLHGLERQKNQDALCCCAEAEMTNAES